MDLYDQPLDAPYEELVMFCVYKFPVMFLLPSSIKKLDVSFTISFEYSKKSSENSSDNAEVSENNVDLTIYPNPSSDFFYLSLLKNSSTSP